VLFGNPLAIYSVSFNRGQNSLIQTAFNGIRPTTSWVDAPCSSFFYSDLSKGDTIKIIYPYELDIDGNAQDLSVSFTAIPIYGWSYTETDPYILNLIESLQHSPFFTQYREP